MKRIIADAHCDSLTKYPDNPFSGEGAQWRKDNFLSVGGDFQIFAIFTPPTMLGSDATAFAVRHCGSFSRQHKSENVVFIKNKEDLETDGLKIMLSLEGAAPIQEDINLLYSFYDLGVRAMGLTWNHRNQLADGIDNHYGLTSFGKVVIKEMEKMGMMIDVSHLNTAGFEDVFNTVSCPIVATHSNARSRRNHKRNLEDWQIKEIIDRGGFIGLNFYTEFVNGINISKSIDPLRARENSITALIGHAEHILGLGGENVLGLGADFDGIEDGTYEDCLGYSDFLAKMEQALQLSSNQIEKISHLNLKRAVGQCISPSL